MEGLFQAGKSDLVVMFSFSKLSREGSVILNHSKSAGYKTLAFVSRTFIPPEERADISLFAYRGEKRNIILWPRPRRFWKWWCLLFQVNWVSRELTPWNSCTS